MLHENVIDKLNFTAFMYAKANILIQYKYIGGDF
jgi:uncharacterized protein YutD